MPNYYNTGTVSVAAGTTTVTGSSVLWSDVRPGDTIEIGDLPGRAIASLTDTNHLELAAPIGVDVVGSTYTIVFNSPQRFTSGYLAEQVRALVARAGILEATAPTYQAQAINTNTPPGSPVNGDMYVLGAAPTGAWVGRANNLAQWTGSAWQFTAPEAGWLAFAEGAGLFVFSGTIWEPGDLGIRPKGAWAIGTTYDAGDMVSHDGRAFVSLVGSNIGNSPPSSESDTAYWMWLPAGPQGVQGEAATIEVGDTTTVAYGTPASVTNVGTSGDAVFDFVIPAGPQGAPGVGSGGYGLPVGGTDGQVLLKDGATDGAAVWGDPPDTFSVADRTALKAMDPAKYKSASLAEAGREGVFVWRTGDYSAEVAADPAEGIYIEADDVAATTGAWVRVFNGSYNVRWFGAVGDGATDDTDAFSKAGAAGVPVYLPVTDSFYSITEIPSGMRSLFYGPGVVKIGDEIQRLNTVTYFANVDRSAITIIDQDQSPSTSNPGGPLKRSIGKSSIYTITRRTGGEGSYGAVLFTHAVEAEVVADEFDSGLTSWMSNENLAGGQGFGAWVGVNSPWSDDVGHVFSSGGITGLEVNAGNRWGDPGFQNAPGDSARWFTGLNVVPDVVPSQGEGAPTNYYPGSFGICISHSVHGHQWWVALTVPYDTVVDGGVALNIGGGSSVGVNVPTVCLRPYGYWVNGIDFSGASFEGHAIKFGAESAAVSATAGAGPNLPATVRGFLKLDMNGTSVRVPYYNA